MKEDKKLGAKHRDCLVVRLITIEYYERFLCYLSFLSLSSDLFICIVVFVNRFLFIRFTEIVGYNFLLKTI